MRDRIIEWYMTYRVRREELSERLAAGQQGEGVVSTAIAVLVMAFLGAAMWVGFNAIFGDAQGKISTQIDTIGG
jgi:hypothetical protein